MVLAYNSATVNDRMHLCLEDSSANVGVSYYPDVNDITVEQWQQWIIDLEDFNSAGVACGRKSGTVRRTGFIRLLSRRPMIRGTAMCSRRLLSWRSSSCGGTGRDTAGISKQKQL